MPIRRGNNKFTTHVQPHLDKIEEWVAQGASQDEIAKNLHLKKSTFATYLQKGREGEEPYTELVERYTRACVEPDDNVEAAMYKLACGYTISLEKTFKVKRSEFDPVTGKKIAEYEELVKDRDEIHVAANVEAQKFWLANRRRDRWSYHPEGVGDEETDFRGVVLLPPVMEKPKEKKE